MTTVEKTAPGASYKWLLLLMLSGAYFLHQADRAIFGTLLPYIQSDLSLSARQLGHINTILFLTIAVVTFFAGFLGDRFNRKRIITASLVFWSLATLGLGFASSFVAVLSLRSIATGGGESFYAPSAMSLLAAHHDKTRSLAFSIHQAALYLGLMLSGFLALRVLGLCGDWRGVFAVFGLAGLLLGLVFVFALRDTRRSETVRAARPSPRTLESFRMFFGNPSALLLTTGFVAICCVNNTYLTWAPKMFHDHFGIEGATAGAHAMFYHHLVAFGAILLGGWLTDRFVARMPRFRLVLQFFALLFGAPFVFLIGCCDSFAGALAMTAAYGLFRGLFEVNTHASVFDVIPVEHRASVVGFMLLLAMGLGALFSGELMGWVFSTFGGRSYVIAFALMGGAYLVGALAIALAFLRTFGKNNPMKG